MEPIWAVGLMTGTVLDGNIDVALLKTDGETHRATSAPTRSRPTRNRSATLLEETLAQARDWNFEGPDPAIFARGRGGADARAVGGGEGAGREPRA